MHSLRRHGTRLVGMTAFVFGFFLLFGIIPSTLADSPEETVAQIESLVKNHSTDKSAISSMVVQLNDPAAPIHVRERAAWAIGQLNLKHETGKLIQAAGHKSLLIRGAALGALIHLRAKEAFAIILQSAQSDSILSLRQQSTLGLGLLGLDQGVKPLAALSSDTRIEVRASAALAMAMLQSKRNDFSGILQEMTTDADPAVQERAKIGLDLAQKKNGEILAHLKSEDVDVRLASAHYFLTSGSKTDLADVKEAFNQEANEEVRQELENAVKVIEKKAKKNQKIQPKKKVHHKKSIKKS